MPFQKGQSGNSKGRKPGSSNKIPKNVKEQLAGLFTRRFKKLAASLDKLPHRDQWDILCKLLPYIVPKLQAMDAKVDLNTLTDEQLTTIIEAIKEEL
ncbi:MAG TPA: DUF5681 domain-containing protein [Paludibacter sp.]|jgi:ribosomal protein L29|nr:DUF5681 domain-containing protein [Paludibacter sp.]